MAFVMSWIRPLGSYGGPLCIVIDSHSRILKQCNRVANETPYPQGVPPSHCLQCNWVASEGAPPTPYVMPSRKEKNSVQFNGERSLDQGHLEKRLHQGPFEKRFQQSRFEKRFRQCHRKQQ